MDLTRFCIEIPSCAEERNFSLYDFNSNKLQSFHSFSYLANAKADSRAIITILVYTNYIIGYTQNIFR